MDSLVLKKWVLWLIAILALLLVAVSFKCVLYGRHSGKSRKGEIVADDVACGVVCMDADVRSAEHRLCQYKRIVSEIASAYSNCQDVVMFKLVDQLSDTCHGLRSEDKVRLVFPLRTIWLSDLKRNEELKGCLLSHEYERRMRTYIALSKTLGNAILNLRLFSERILLEIDYMLLKRLQDDRDKFMVDGDVESAKVAEHFIGEWIMQIESDNGFSRVYMRSQNQGLELIVTRREVSAKELREDLRKCSLNLRRMCGYTPKWLDKEFPVLEEKPANK